MHNYLNEACNYMNENGLCKVYASEKAQSNLQKNITIVSTLLNLKTDGCQKLWTNGVCYLSIIFTITNDVCYVPIITFDWMCLKFQLS